MLSLSGIDRRLLADPYPSGTPLGEVTQAAPEATGLAAGTPVVLGGHDYLCGALPVGAIRHGRGPGREGTWEIVLATTETPILTPDMQRTGDGRGARRAQPVHHLGRAVSPICSSGYRKEFGFEAQYQAGQCAASIGTSSWLRPRLYRKHGAMFLPHLSGGGCPTVDPRSLGGFVG